MIDRDLHLARALLVESNAMLRSVAAGQLKDIGVGHVSNCSRARDARLLLERERFDIVVCSRELDGSDMSGQDLLDELRRENLLPPSTVFIMVAAQATYAQVVEAAESALDGFITRPCTTAVLAERLLEARQRKRALADILKAVDAGELEAAFARALKRFQERAPYGMWCGRLAAELLLRMDRPGDALKVFAKLHELKPAPWAQLGVARAQIAANDLAAARRTTAEVLAQEPHNADAHDLMGRLLVDLCDFEAALGHYREAAGLTPGCLLRAQHAGALAFYRGEGAEALSHLERAMSIGAQSKLFDALTWVMAALLHLDAGNAGGVRAMREQLVRFRQKFPDSRRLARLEKACEVLSLLSGGEPVQALESLREWSAEVGQDDFDLESANVLLALWSRLPPQVLPKGPFEALVEQLAMRFATSKSIGEALVASARHDEAAAAVVRRCQASLSATTQRAMELSLSGQPARAVDELLESGAAARNAKLLEMAGLIARRQQAALADGGERERRATELLQRHCATVNHIAGIQRTGRSPGGLQVRA
jgi:DNA-binding NarL/FixJ family response regulator